MSAKKYTVEVDAGRCQAYGICVAIQPDVFDVPAGSPAAIVLREIIDEQDREEVEEAARSCPAQAIAIRAAVSA